MDLEELKTLFHRMSYEDLLKLKSETGSSSPEKEALLNKIIAQKQKVRALLDPQESTLNRAVRDYASNIGLSESDVIEQIKSGKLNGYEENGYWYVKITDSNNTNSSFSQDYSENSSTSFQNNLKEVSPPLLTYIFYALAILGLLGSTILAIRFIPDGSASQSADDATGRIAYYASIFIFISGIIEAVIFSAMGAGLKYLNEIAINTRNNRQQ